MIWTESGPEFSSNTLSTMIVEKTLCCLKSLGAIQRAMFTATPHKTKFVPTKVDPDVWIKISTKHDRAGYYEMILIYADDTDNMCLSDVC